MKRVAAGFVAVVVVFLSPPVSAGEFADPVGPPGALLRIDPSGGTAGLRFPGESTAGWVGAGFDYRILGTSLLGGARHRLVDRPVWELDAWGELRAELLARGRPAFAGGLETGLRNLFSRWPVRWSAGVSVDAAAAFTPATSFRYRPEAHLGLGVMAVSSSPLPDAAWLRGALGYDFAADQLGAIHADIGLTLHWRFANWM